MLTILGGLLGLITSALPEAFRWLRARQDQAHEIRMTELQIEAQAATAQQRLEEVRVESERALGEAMSREQVALIEAQRPTGIRWIDALSASVRPLVTYAFVAMYASVKIAQYNTLFNERVAMTWSEAIATLWTGEDMAVFMAVISYWFGARALARHRQGAN